MATESQRRAVRKYDREKIDMITLPVHKGEKVSIAAFAKVKGETMNGMIVRLIREEMERG